MQLFSLGVHGETCSQCHLFILSHRLLDGGSGGRIRREYCRATWGGRRNDRVWDSVDPGIESPLSLIESIDKAVCILQEGYLCQLMTTPVRIDTMKGDTLATGITTSRTTLGWEPHCRRDVTAVARNGSVERAAHRTTATRAMSLTTKTLVEVVDLDETIDLPARSKTETRIEHGGHVNFDAILVDLHVRLAIDSVRCATETRERVEATQAEDALLHSFLVERSTIDNADSSRIHSVESGTLHP